MKDENNASVYYDAKDSAVKADVSMSVATEEFKSAVSDAKMLNSSAASDSKNGAGRDSFALMPKSSSIEEEWKKLKLQNQLLNNEMRTTDIQSTLSSQDLPLPLNKDGSLSFFWFDAHEENHGRDIYLFGKVWQP